MKYKNLTYIIVIILATITHSCVEPFEPDIEGHDDLLVVDALVTNDVGESFVSLSKSFGYNDIDKRSVKDADVNIKDGQGNVYYFFENSNGEYLPNDPNFTGQAGQEYQLNIELLNGEVFQSDFMEFKNSPLIDTVITVYDEYTTADDDLIQGMRILVSTHDSNNETWYYRWQWDETYETRVQVGSFKYKDRQVCYISSKSNSLEIASSANLSEDKIIDNEIAFIDNKSYRLINRYSMLIKQYALSKEAFDFFRDIEKQNINTGSLFDPIPSVIYSNVSNITNPQHIALGYFIVAGVSKKRIIIDRLELPTNVWFPKKENCEITCRDSAFIINDLTSNGWFHIEYISGSCSSSIPGWYHWFTRARTCVDCSMLGPTKKPDYWDQ